MSAKRAERVDPISSVAEYDAVIAGKPAPQEESVLRFDPSVGEGSGGAAWNNLENREYGRRYVWVSKTSGSAGEILGIRAFQRRGYRIEKYAENGVRMPFGSGLESEPKLGENVEDGWGNILMSCSESQHTENRYRDPITGRGQHTVDRYEDQILDKRRQGEDVMRGLHGRTRKGVAVVEPRDNPISKEVAEVGVRKGREGTFAPDEEI